MNKEKSKDLIILVHYLPAGNMSKKQLQESAQLIRKNLDRYDDIIFYIIPTEDEHRVECINPKLVNEEEYKKASLLLKKAEKYAQMIIDGKVNKKL